MNQKQEQSSVNLKDELKKFKNLSLQLQKEKEELEKNNKYLESQAKEYEKMVKDRDEKISFLVEDLENKQSFDYTVRDGEGVHIYGVDDKSKINSLRGTILNMWRDNKEITPILTKLYYK